MRPAASPRTVGLAAAGLSVLAFTGCARTPPGRPAARHLVLVTIDTLRADRLGCYGSTTVATPHLDAVAREGALAEHATVNVPLTRPSHISIFTGLYPAEHGIRDNVSPSLSPDVPLLAEMLKKAGFATAGFVSAVVVSRQSGLNRGFDVYSDRFEAGGDDARFLNAIQKRGDGPTAEAIAWLQSRRDGRDFVWLHLYDPHDPYEPPEPYASRYAGRPYDGEVAWSDELLGRLDAALVRQGRREDTLLVVTSDHGEGLGEHGETVHGFFVYESTLRVPLLMRGPGIRAGGRLPVVARSVDLVPTLLDLLGVAAPTGRHFAGRTLAGALRDGESIAPEAAYAESLLPLVHYGWSDLRALRDERWKYIQAPRPELYDLEHDPGEGHNLVASEPARAEAFRVALTRRLAGEKAAPPVGAAAVPVDLLEKLGALGYLGAGTPPSGATTGADPKDKIEEYKVLNRLVREGLIRLREHDYTGSIARFRELLRRGVGSFEVHYYLARGLAALGQPREAASHYESALTRLPGFVGAILGLADSRIALGDLPGALAALQKGAGAGPDARVLEREAQVWRRLKRLPEARRAYEAAVALAPRDALLRVQLAEVCRDAGELQEAVRRLREAVDIDPTPASYWNSLGMVLGAGNDLAEAEKAFREALSRDAKSAEYSYNLGLALLRQQRRYEAADSFRRAAALEPAFRAPRERLAEMGIAAGATR
jgi:arylsulfatase A-like enzyme/tetratricopeptide (TPR) repeat protein